MLRPVFFAPQSNFDSGQGQFKKEAGDVLAIGFLVDTTVMLVNKKHEPKGIDRVVCGNPYREQPMI